MSLSLAKRKSQYKGTLYPNGEFSYGWDSADYTREIRDSEEYQTKQDKSWYSLTQEGDEDNQDAITQIWHEDARRLGLLTEQEKAESLTLSYPTNPHKIRTIPKRTRGISSKAQKVIRNCAWLLEEQEGKRNLTFCTITIPPLPEDFRSYLNKNWGDFKRRFIQELTRRLKAVGSSTNIIEVTEIQEKRYAATGQFYLHSHLVWGNSNRTGCRLSTAALSLRSGANKQFAIDVSWLRGLLYRLLVQDFYKSNGVTTTDASNFFCPPFQFPRVEVARVRGSVSRYLAKYLSKGASTVARFTTDKGVDVLELPRQWHYVGGGLRKVLKKRLRKFGSEVADFLNWVSSNPELSKKYFVWSRDICVLWNEREVKIGVSGKLTASGQFCLSRKFPILSVS
jgi:hypothetical protein